MDARTLLIAFGFATLAAAVVALGWQGQERYAAAQKEQATARAAAPDVPTTEAQSPTLVWLKGDLSSNDRLVLAMLCMAAATAAYLWLLITAFQEGPGWGFAVLLGNWVGALAFCVFGTRRSMAPLFVMTAAYGLLFLLR